MNAIGDLPRKKGEVVSIFDYEIPAYYIILFRKETIYYQYAYYWLGRINDINHRTREAIICYEQACLDIKDEVLLDYIRFRLAVLKAKGDPEISKKIIQDLMQATSNFQVIFEGKFYLLEISNRP
jgi:hypothetical protein